MFCFTKTTLNSDQDKRLTEAKAMKNIVAPAVRDMNLKNKQKYNNCKKKTSYACQRIDILQTNSSEYIKAYKKSYLPGASHFRRTLSLFGSPYIKVHMKRKFLLSRSKDHL